MSSARGGTEVENLAAADRPPLARSTRLTEIKSRMSHEAIESKFQRCFSAKASCGPHLPCPPAPLSNLALPSLTSYHHERPRPANEDGRRPSWSPTYPSRYSSPDIARIFVHNELIKQIKTIIIYIISSIIN